MAARKGWRRELNWNLNDYYRYVCSFNFIQKPLFFYHIHIDIYKTVCYNIDVLDVWHFLLICCPITQQFNSFIIQSVGYAVKSIYSGIISEKGMGCESPASIRRCMRKMFFVPWRKPVIGNPRRQNRKCEVLYLMMRESQDLLWCYPMLFELRMIFLYT